MKSRFIASNLAETMCGADIRIFRFPKNSSIADRHQAGLSVPEQAVPHGTLRPCAYDAKLRRRSSSKFQNIRAMNCTSQAVLHRTAGRETCPCSFASMSLCWLPLGPEDGQQQSNVSVCVRIIPNYE